MLSKKGKLLQRKVRRRHKGLDDKHHASEGGMYADTFDYGAPGPQMLSLPPSQGLGSTPIKYMWCRLI